jgi:hypothetical protein
MRNDTEFETRKLAVRGELFVRKSLVDGRQSFGMKTTLIRALLDFCPKKMRVAFAEELARRGFYLKSLIRVG